MISLFVSSSLANGGDVDELGLVLCISLYDIIMIHAGGWLKYS